MVENIVVEFTSNTEGITTAEQAVQQLDKSTADQFTKTNASLKERQTLIDKNTAGLAQYAQKVQDAGKAAAGAFSAKGLQDFKKVMGDSANGVKLLENSLNLLKTRLQKSVSDEEFKKINAEIAKTETLLTQLKSDAGDALGGLGDSTEKTSAKTQSFRAQLRAMKDELNALENAGQEDTQRFTELSVAAGKLEDRIGDVNQRIRAMSSDSFVFDALISGMQGVAGAFAVGQGAIGLFGDNSEELQQTLLKVNAAMAILQGLQQVQNLIADQSIAKTGVEVALQKIRTLQTNLDTAAESGNIVVRYAAIAAQSALNVVMAANPAGLLLTAIAAVAGALLYFTSNTDKATEQQKLFNEELKNELDLLDSLNTELLKPYDDRIKQLNNELTVLKSKNVAQGVILQKEAQLAKANSDRANAQKGYLGKEVQDLDLVSAKIENQTELVNNLQNQLNNKSNEGFLAKWFSAGGKSKSELEQMLKNAQDQLANFQKQYTLGSKARDDADKASADKQAKDGEIAKYNREQYIKNAIAGADALVLREIEGTNSWLKAELNAIEVKKATDLLNVNLTEGERAKIIAEARQSEAKAQFDFEQKQADIASKGIDARANLQNEGTKTRLNLELVALDMAKAKELQEYVNVNGEQIRIKKLTEDQKAEIDNRYAKLRIDKTNATNQKIAEDEINSRISGINSRISQLQLQGAKADNEQLLQLKKDLIDEQAFAEVTSIAFTIKNEELRRKKTQEVYDKALADKKQLERDKAAAEITSALDYQQAYEQLQADRAQRVLDNQKSSLSQRNKAQGDYFLHSQNQLLNELGAEEDRYNRGIITYEEYQTKKLQIQDKQEALSFQHTQAVEAKKQALQQASLQLISNIGNALFDALKSSYDDDLAANQELADKKLITQQELDKRTRAIKRQQAVLDKEAALFNIAISVAQAIASHLKTPYLIPFDIATGIAETAFVLAKPLPKFRKGGFTGNKGVDEEAGVVHGQEFVAHAAATKKYQPLLEAINADKLNEYLKAMSPAAIEYPTMSLPQFEMPTMSPIPGWAMDRLSSSSPAVPINYKALAEHIADEIVKKQGRIEDLPTHDITIDKSGIHIIAKEGLDRTEFLNNKYSFKRK